MRGKSLQNRCARLNFENDFETFFYTGCQAHRLGKNDKKMRKIGEKMKKNEKKWQNHRKKCQKMTNFHLKN